MLTPSTLTLVDAVAQDARKIGLATHSAALRAQAALVRALVEEVWHRHPSERRVVALHAHLADELARLAWLAADSPASDTGAAVQPLDVIVVEDDPSALLAITMLVRGLGYVCRAANSAEEALLLYEARPAAIVVSDWDLPGMSGTDLCRALKQRDPHAYVLLLTAFDEPRGLVDTQGRGVDDFLRKPVDIDELEARLRAAEGLVRAVQTLKVLATV